VCEGRDTAAEHQAGKEHEARRRSEAEGVGAAMVLAGYLVVNRLAAHTFPNWAA
jgi:hypothetical protein